uniref:Transthyretin-like family protein n=1 Tax=Syphacia muris TaxID=451379 RepID=A0A0N5AY67_9BILA
MLCCITLFAIIPACFCAMGGLVGRTQSAAVTGKLLCNGKPASDVLVKLYDDDRGLDFDDLMAEGTTNERGEFSLSGWNQEVSTIDPKLNIYHDCNDGWWPCQRKISFMIPDEYVTIGKVPKRPYNAGEIELAGEWAGETRDCIH